MCHNKNPLSKNLLLLFLGGGFLGRGLLGCFFRCGLFASCFFGWRSFRVLLCCWFLPFSSLRLYRFRRSLLLLWLRQLRRGVALSVESNLCNPHLRIRLP